MFATLYIACKLSKVMWNVGGKLTTSKKMRKIRVCRIGCKMKNEIKVD